MSPIGFTWEIWVKKVKNGGGTNGLKLTKLKMDLCLESAFDTGKQQSNMKFENTCKKNHSNEHIRLIST